MYYKCRGDVGRSSTLQIRETVLGHMVRGGRPSALDRTFGQRLAFAALHALEAGENDFMASWDAPMPVGKQTQDPHVTLVPLGEVLTETEHMLDGSSPVVQGWIKMLNRVEDLLLV